MKAERGRDALIVQTKEVVGGGEMEAPMRSDSKLGQYQAMLSQRSMFSGPKSLPSVGFCLFVLSTQNLGK